MIKITPEELKPYYVTSFWDYPQRGICHYNDRLALFEAHDETDYETMTDTCPCCSSVDGDNWQDCHCENARDLYYYATELPWYKRIYYKLYPYWELNWYIRHYGAVGIEYWKRWKY